MTLASVLGAQYTVMPINSDFNDYKTPGRFFTLASRSDYLNIPFTGQDIARGILVVEKMQTTAIYVRQTYTEMVDKANITFQRTFDDTWSAWVRVDNFGCATPEALASLLGVMQVQNYGSGVNLDNLRTGWGYVSTSSNGFDYGIYIGIFRDSSVGTQIFFQASEGIYLRSHTANGWSDWKKAVLSDI